MMRSLSSAVAGLKTHQTKMDVIGNNIANVNTYGFKASRASFSDVYYQNLSGASSPKGLIGGTNPTQIGYGSLIATIDMMITQSGASSTDRALDVYIAGDGFLISRDPNGKTQYSRLGVLKFDAEGNLVDGNGHFILGFKSKTDADGNVVPDIPSNGKAEVDQLAPIKVTPPAGMTLKEFFDSLTGISISTSGEIIGITSGGTQITLSSAMPAWVNRESFSISESSTYAGNVQIAISGLPDAGAMSTAMGSKIDKVEMGTMALNAGSYNVSVDASTNTVTMSFAGPPVINMTGTLKDGKIILKDSAGNVGMTLYTTENLQSTTQAVWNYPTLSAKGNLKIGNATPTANEMAAALGLLPGDVTGITGDIAGGNYTVTVLADGKNVQLTDPSDPSKTMLGSLNSATGILKLSGNGNTIEMQLKANPTTYPALTDGTVAVSTGAAPTADDVARALGLSSGGLTLNVTTGTLPSDDYTVTVSGNNVKLTIANSGTPIELDGTYDSTTGKLNLSGGGIVAEIQLKQNPTTYVALTANSSNALTVNGPVPTTADLIAALGLTATNASSLDILPPDSYTVSVSGKNVTIKGTGTNVLTGTVDDLGKLELKDSTGAIVVTIQTFATQGTKIGSNPVDLQLYQQMTAVDKGGNKIKEPAEPTLFTYPGAGQPIQFGDISFTFNADPAGRAMNMQIGSAGAGEGNLINIGNLALAKFPNNEGLRQSGSSYYESTLNSGVPICVRPGLEGTGITQAGYLEMSNVDLSKEFTDMITTQRGFQANTRIVTVSDEMLQELVNLKR